MKRLSVNEYAQGVLAGDRFLLSRAITLVESNRPSDRELAQALLQELLPQRPRHTLRVGITGAPGVGKSSFIEAFGQHLTEQGVKLAVLAIDPSSQQTKGSILGDKTRMEQLARNPLAYIRPSASGSTLGGVARKTREAILLCELAGFEVVLVETVGVGQSEVVVKEMTDFFLLLMLAGAGDELQGIKKGIMEMADALAITKADGDNRVPAKRARAEYASALHLFPPHPSGWVPQVLTCSAQEGEGLADIWRLLRQFRESMEAKGWLEQQRAQQQRHWMHDAIREALLEQFYAHPGVQAALPGLESAVLAGQLPATAAAERLLGQWREG